MLKKLATLFWDFFRISLFVVGGGYAIMAVADDYFYRKRSWTKEGELIGHLPIFQMVPGIMAAHSAVYVGRKVGGILGSFVALAAVALPSILIFTAVSMGYDALPMDNIFLNAAFLGLRASLAGIIIAMTLRLWLSMAQDISEWRKTRRADILAALVFLKYGLVAFGGGYVLVPLYLHDFVGASAARLQIAPEEFANLMALTQMTPGPIGLNAATFFGYRLFGAGGAIITTLCLMLPGFFILTALLKMLESYGDTKFVKRVMAVIRPLTALMMTSASWSFLKMSVWHDGLDLFALSIAAMACLLVWTKKLGVVNVIFLSTGTTLAARFLIYLTSRMS